MDNMMFPNGMTHAQTTEMMPRLGLALGIIGLLILVFFLLSKFVFFPTITEIHEKE